MSEINEVEVNKTVQQEVPKKELYTSAYDMLKSLFWHMNNKINCKGAKIEDDSFEDKKTMRHEVGWKCSHCGESWNISVRQLRNTIRDARLREFAGYSYMNTFADLRKVLAKK